jgi:hypothetical protein
MSEEQSQQQVAFAVTGGGAPSAEELAALTIALTPVAGDDSAPDDGTQASGWRRAALVEGVGGRNAASLPDLISGRMGLGHVGDPHADL